MADKESTSSLQKLPAAAPGREEFDLKLISPFTWRSTSEETRRAYRRVVTEFFRYFKFRHPAEISAEDIREWRDQLIKARKSPATVVFKLSVIRSMFDFLKGEGLIAANPALAKKVPPPRLSDDLKGRVLEPKEVGMLLAGPDRRRPEGARDYALMLLMLRTSLRAAEACSLKASSVRWSHGRWVLRIKVKGGRERSIPLPGEVKKAIDEYLKLDRSRRHMVGSGGPEAWIFQPISNQRTLEYAKPLSTTMVWHIVKKWGEYTGVGKLSPHDLRRTAITRALDQGLSYRQVQMMSGHRDPKTVMRYDHHRENMDQNAINFLNYGEALSDPGIEGRKEGSEGREGE